MIRIEVLEVLPEHVRVRVSSRGGGPPKTEEQTLPHAPRVSLEPPELDEQTTIKVPAGTFPCRHRRWTVKSARAAWTVELWDDPAFPLPYRQYVQGPRTTDLRLISVTAPH